MDDMVGRRAASGITITRAWPGKKRDRTVEGRDTRGHLRAGVLAARDGEPVTGDLDARAVAWLPHGRDPKLPTLALGPGDELLVHRAGRRAVVRRVDGAFVKHLRSGRAQGVAGTSAALADLCRAHGIDAPEVLECGNGHVVFSPLMGSSAGLETLDAALGVWAAHWPGLVTDSSFVGGSLPVHGPAEEAAVVDTWIDHLLTFRPASWVDGSVDRLRVLALRARKALMGQGRETGQDLTPTPGSDHAAARGHDRLVVAHRDLHDGQVLWDADTGALGLLDFDTAALAEPELDVANLLVHLWLRADQGLWSQSRARRAHKIVRGVSDRLGLDPVRLDAYRLATAVRLVGVYGFRPAWQDPAGRWARELADATP
ncbi:phosphotransferase [Brevibacterium litoralis]|uniref:phosphotransferase n=1 Tax=Brevibacterium litoralis TaxID=3138935 RepID=UPI0032EC4E44